MFSTFDKLTHMVGNTPLLEIHFNYNGRRRRIFVKAESYNLTGSIKDRMALYVLKRAHENNLLKKNAYIAEATSGNTGIAFSAIGALIGHPVIIFMPEWMSVERKRVLKSYGADLRLVTEAEGGFIGSVEKTLQFKDMYPDTFLPEQFTNPDNPMAHYLTTGLEITRELDSLNLKPDGFVAGVGTGGTVMGVGRRLREANPEVKIYPLEPAEAPAIACGIEGGTHRIEGIGDGFVPGQIHMDELDDPLTVQDGDAIVMAQKLGLFGLGVGISSGANFIGAVKALEKLGDEKIIVTVFPDDNKKYLTTDLMNEIESKPGYYSTHIDLIDVISY